MLLDFRVTDYSLDYWICEKYEMPEYEQLLKVAQVCHSLSDMRQDILLFLYDEENNEFFILAGKKATIEVTVSSNATVEVKIGEEL